MIRFLTVALLLVGGGCTNNRGDEAYGRRACGLLACVSSPYLRAKLSPSIIGQPVGAALTSAGAPTNTYRSGDAEHLTWRRTQNDASLGMLACEETVRAEKGRIVSYRFDGHC